MIPTPPHVTGRTKASSNNWAADASTTASCGTRGSPPCAKDCRQPLRAEVELGRPRSSARRRCSRRGRKTLDHPSPRYRPSGDPVPTQEQTRTEAVDRAARRGDTETAGPSFGDVNPNLCLARPVSLLVSSRMAWGSLATASGPDSSFVRNCWSPSRRDRRRLIHLIRAVLFFSRCRVRCDGVPSTCHCRCNVQ